MVNGADKIENNIRKMLIGNQVGVSPDASMRNQNGLDPIDLEAEKQGQARRKMRSMAPAKRHVYCRVI